MSVLEKVYLSIELWGPLRSQRDCCPWRAYCTRHPETATSRVNKVCKESDWNSCMVSTFRSKYLWWKPGYLFALKKHD